MTFKDWIVSLCKEYFDEQNSEILKADIKMLVRRPDGSVVIRHSEYQAKTYKGIDLKYQNSSTICG